MTNQQVEFLRRLRDGHKLALADRVEDRARQWCRQNGLAEVLPNPRRWVITEAGRKALEGTE